MAYSKANWFNSNLGNGESGPQLLRPQGLKLQEARSVDSVEWGCGEEAATGPGERF